MINDDRMSHRNGPKFTLLKDCQHDAVILAGMMEGIDLMSNEGPVFDNARVAVTMAALELAKKLADDLDRVTP